MSRRIEGPARVLPEGVYEHLITQELARALEARDALARIVEPVDDADAHVAIARHVGDVVARVLSGMPADRAYVL